MITNSVNRKYYLSNQAARVLNNLNAWSAFCPRCRNTGCSKGISNKIHDFLILSSQKNANNWPIRCLVTSLIFFQYKYQTGIFLRNQQSELVSLDYSLKWIFFYKIKLVCLYLTNMAENTSKRKASKVSYRSSVFEFA